MQSITNKESFLKIIRLGIGHSVYDFPESVDWNVIKTLAVRQELGGVLVDGIERLPEEKRPPKETVLQLIGNTLQNYECRYELYSRAIANLSAWYKTHGFKMMVLKGLACSLDWPNPQHRLCGDIDIWLFGNQEKADALMEKEISIKIDRSHHHHTVFIWKGFLVENHFDFDNTHVRRSNKELEVTLKMLGNDDSCYVEVNGEKVFLPHPNFQALFLLRHMVGHFSAAEISIRHVLDWAFFVEKHSHEVDWTWLLTLLDKYHMNEFFNCINGICVENLGFSACSFPSVQFSPELKERILEDILEPKYSAAEPTKLIPRVLYKYRRWHSNAWKQELCYNESRWSMFWMGIWAKILKPASI